VGSILAGRETTCWGGNHSERVGIMWIEQPGSEGGRPVTSSLWGAEWGTCFGLRKAGRERKRPGNAEKAKGGEPESGENDSFTCTVT